MPLSHSALTSWSLVIGVALALGGPAGAKADDAMRSQRITIDLLKSLKSTANDPSGDAFGGSREDLTRLIDAMVQDASLVSPTYLFLASKTAFTLGRLEDAAFLFYAAQLRAKFDIDRYGMSTQSADSPAIYLGFLRQTIGESVNPAVMREPATFAAVVKRLEQWEIVPSPQAFYPEFESKPKFKVPPEQWTSHAASLRTEFMSVFGRQSRLLNDREYFEAFRFVQAMNFGEVPSTSENQARFAKSMAAMESAEKRLFPEPEPTNAQPAVRAGQGGVPVPTILRRVEPEFPTGAKGTVILEVTIGSDGTVTDVRVLRGDPALDPAAVKAVRQWRFEVTRIDGRPVSVVHTVTVAAR